MRPLGRLFLLCCCASICAACGTTAPTITPQIVQVGAPFAGLIATVGSPVTISVRVADTHANALPGVVVTWSPPLNTGHVSSATSTTDAQGNASVQWTLDTLAGANTVTVTVPGAVPLTISATGTS